MTSTASTPQTAPARRTSQTTGPATTRPTGACRRCRAGAATTVAHPAEYGPRNLPAAARIRGNDRARAISLAPARRRRRRVHRAEAKATPSRRPRWSIGKQVKKGIQEMITSTKYGATKGKMLALGVLLAALMASLMLAVKPSHASTTFTVDSTADYGDVAPGDGKCDIGTIMLIGERCTLRAAIQEANATSGTDTINFAIPTTEDPTIAPASELPKITRTVTINGYSQPGAQPNSKTVGT